LTPGSRLLIITNILSEVLCEISLSDVPTDTILNKWYRKNRYAGSKDRKEISDSIFGILRHYYIINNIIYDKFTSYNLSNSIKFALIYYVLFKYNYEEVVNLLDDGPYAIKMNNEISTYLEAIKQISFSNNFKNEGLPDWIYKEFLITYKNETQNVCESLLDQSNIDIRVSKDSDREKILNKILNFDKLAHKTIYSPYGIRLSKRIAFNVIKNLKNYFIEFQDEGSQLAILLSGVKDNEVVLDLCAGAGGKTLMLCDIKKNVKIIATDIDSSRLLKIKKRLSWDKYKNRIELYENFINLDLLVDRVICDVPCSGSGAWRRRPEEKIRITKKRFQELINIQSKILLKGANLLKVGGELVYITCSLLKKENSDQIENFIKKNSEFEIVDLKYSWNNIVKSDSWIGDSSFCQLLPNINKCDGFFVARLRKNK
tara:strand:- start:22472 stop:23758 length:1287 start_codon:yes stop_codon:yes gene_type:complete